MYNQPIDIKKKFQSNFLQLLNNEIILKRLFYEIFIYGTAYVVGGYLRDFLCGKKSRDLDIIVDINNAHLLDIVSELSCNFETNRHGGIKLKLDNISVDLWSLENNWAFKNKLVKLNDEDRLNSIAKGCFFNYDSLVINLHNYTYNIRYYTDFQNNKILDILQKLAIYKIFNPTVEANIIRAIYIKYKFNSQFSDNTLNYMIQKTGSLRDQYEDEIQRIISIKSKYPKYNELSNEQLQEELLNLRKIIRSNNQLFLDF